MAKYKEAKIKIEVDDKQTKATKHDRRAKYKNIISSKLRNAEITSKYEAGKAILMQKINWDGKNVENAWQIFRSIITSAGKKICGITRTKKVG